MTSDAPIPRLEPKLSGFDTAMVVVSLVIGIGIFRTPALVAAATAGAGWFLAAWAAEEKKGVKPIPALFTAMDVVSDVQTEKLAIPRRFTAVMKDIWVQQPRFEQRSGRRPYALLAQEKFRAGYDFLALRATSGEVPQELADWWERFQRVSDDERQAMLIEPKEGESKARTRRRRRRKSPGAGAAPNTTTE